MMELASWWITARALRKTAEEQRRFGARPMLRSLRARTIAGHLRLPECDLTLRLSFGTVIGYEEGGPRCGTVTAMSACTPGRNMEQRSTIRSSAALEKRKSKLNQDTHLNFVSTCDIIGAIPAVRLSTGRPFVGIIFDGNLASLPWDYHFSQEQGRAFPSIPAAIVHALDRVYNARELVRDCFGNVPRPIGRIEVR